MARQRHAKAPPGPRAVPGDCGRGGKRLRASNWTRREKRRKKQKHNNVQQKFSSGILFRRRRRGERETGGEVRLSLFAASEMSRFPSLNRAEESGKGTTSLHFFQATKKKETCLKDSYRVLIEKKNSFPTPKLPSRESAMESKHLSHRKLESWRMRAEFSEIPKERSGSISISCATISLQLEFLHFSWASGSSQGSGR